jgi:cellobiose-specific phosphotransferase system component IIC
VVDLGGLFLVLGGKRLASVMGDVSVKILGVALGWAAAELLASNFVSIILQGWSNELKTEYIVAALAANLDILEIIGLTTLAYALTKKQDSNRTAIYLLALVRYLFPVALRYAKESTEASALADSQEATLSETSMLGAKAAFAVGFYFIAQQFK